jgi:hypothetical protein
VKAWFAAVMFLMASAARATDLSASIPRYNPAFPVFAAGNFVNILDNNQTLTNASAHVGWALAVPLAGEYLGGRKGLWVAGLSWVAVTLAQEAFFHAPVNPGPAYPSEVRTDLLTRLVPTAALLAWDLMHQRGPRVTPAQRSEPPLAPARVETLEAYPSLRSLCLDVAPAPARVASAAPSGG